MIILMRLFSARLKSLLTVPWLWPAKTKLLVGSLFLLSTFYFLLSTSPALARPFGATDVNLHTWTQVNNQDWIFALDCIGTGCDWSTNPPNCDTGCASYTSTGQLVMGENRGGAIGTAGYLISQLYQPPASSVQYIAYLKENLGLATPAYAQGRGSGFSGLSYLLPVWQLFRNVAYIIFVLLFLMTGLLIMLRVKISPQAVISIQNALPRLALALVIISLSYAIVGLLIDITYVIIDFTINILSTALPDPGEFRRTLGEYQARNVFDYWGKGYNLGFNTATGPSQGVRQLLDSLLGIQNKPPFLQSLFGAPGAVAQGLVVAIFMIAILFALFRLFFSLLKSYIWIIVLLVFGPFILLSAALPGSTLGVSGWLRGLLANLVIFPTAVAMFALASVFITLAQAASANPAWAAPLLGAESGQGLMSLIGLGMILLTPQVTQMMNDAFKPPPFPYGAAIGQSLGAGPGVVSGVGRRIGAAAPLKPAEWSPLRGILPR